MGGEGDPVMPQAPLQVSRYSLSPYRQQLTYLVRALQARNYVLACYAVSLVRGETLLNIRIRYKTLRNYVNDAIKLHTQRSGKHGGQQDERLPNPHNAKVDYIEIVLKAVRKYELMPKRREMIYDEMVAKMLKRQAKLSPDSVEAALIDWIILGRYAGYRCSEWRQETQTSYSEIDHPLWVGPTAEAFVAEDVTFYDRSQRPIHNLASITIEDVFYVRLRYRKQKNDNNGEIIPYERDTERLDLCPVYAALRIRQRALRLDVAADHPIGVYKPKKLSTRAAPGVGYHYITRDQVEKYLRSIGIITFSLAKTDPMVSRWSSHSIRVTACNLLHRQGLPDSYIQQRLRWKSKAWRDYIRNTIYSAAQHKAALQITSQNIPVLVDETTGKDSPMTRSQPEELDRVVGVGLAACAA